MSVPILEHSGTLIVSLQSEPTDAEFLELEQELTEGVGSSRARGVLIDVSALSVLDSFATRTLREVAHAVRLRGAMAAIVGIQPDVAFAMVQLGLSLDGTLTALNLEDGLSLLHEAAALPLR